MRKHALYVLILAAFLISNGLGTSVSQAQNTWQWQMTLQGEPSGKPMKMPAALYIDEELARYYAVDAGNNRLLSFDREGTFLNVFDAKGQLQQPVDMVKAADGKLWVVEKGRNTLTSIDLKSREVTPHPVTNKGKSLALHRVETAAGVFYVLDKASGKIFALNPGLEVIFEYGCQDCDGGFADFKVVNNRIWALAQVEKAVYRFEEKGEQGVKIPLQEGLQFPCSLELDAAGRLYILDRHAGAVMVYDSTGKFNYSFLSPGQARGQLSYPIELRFDPWGRLCIVEEGNGRIEVFRH